MILAIAIHGIGMTFLLDAERDRANRANARYEEAVEIAAECLAIGGEALRLHQETSFDLPRGYEARLPSGMGGER